MPDELEAALKAQERSGFNDGQITGKSDSKRKANEPSSAEKVVKKARLSESEDTESENSDEEEWQSTAAEQLSAEAEEIRKRKEEEQQKQDLQEAFAANEIVMPRTVDLSVEEGKALFKVCIIISDGFNRFRYFSGTASGERH